MGVTQRRDDGYFPRLSRHIQKYGGHLMIFQKPKMARKCTTLLARTNLTIMRRGNTVGINRLHFGARAVNMKTIWYLITSKIIMSSLTTAKPGLVSSVNNTLIKTI